MHFIPWNCPNAWWLAASVAVVFLMVEELFRWRRRHRLQQARSKAERVAREHAATALQESMLQSGQGLILRFEAIARGLPQDDPARRELMKVLDRAERVLEKGLDRAQYLRDEAGQRAGADESKSP